MKCLICGTEHQVGAAFCPAYSDPASGRVLPPDHDAERVGDGYACKACGRRWALDGGPGMSCPGRVATTTTEETA